MIQKKVKTFILPGMESNMEQILNNPNITVTDKVKVPCAKEGIIIVYIEYEEFVQGGEILEYQD